MEIGDRQQVGLAIRQPPGARQALALRAVPVATTIEGDTNHAAVVAALGMAAEHCGTTSFDGCHHATLAAREPTALCRAERFAVVAENIRHLQYGTHGPRLRVRHYFNGEIIERTRRGCDQSGRDLGISSGCLQMAMP